jgi:hypothetical protein
LFIWVLLLHFDHEQKGNENSQNRADLREHIGFEGRDEFGQAEPQEEQDHNDSTKRHITLSFGEMVIDYPNWEALTG